MAIPVFPTLPGLEYPVKRTPLVSTLRQKAISGRETFQPLWNAPRYRYEVSFALLRAAQPLAEWQLLMGFWNGVMVTPGGLFQFVDPVDNAVVGQPLATGDGSTTSFQLFRTLGGFNDPILNPTPAVAAPGSTLDYGNCTVAPTTTLDYGNCTTAPTLALDYGYCSTMLVVSGALLQPYVLQEGGVITIEPAPTAGAALTWTGTYSWLCRFDEDSLEFSNFMYLFWELKKCAFTTVRL